MIRSVYINVSVYMMNVACKGRRVKELHYNIHYILHAGTVSLNKKLVDCLDVIAQTHLCVI